VNRPLRIAAYVAAGLALGVLLALGAIQLITRTEFGQERVRRFALDWLDDQVHGAVRIGGLSGGGLLGGVTVHDFAIDDTGGRTFVHADSARIAYDWKTLLGGSIVLDDVILYSPEVAIEKLPGDTLWNYEHIFADTTAGESSGPGRLILINDARIVDGTVFLRRPWEPDEPVEVEDTARTVLEPLGSGQVSVIRFEIDEAELPRVIWESPLEEGRMFNVASFRGQAYLWRDPVIIDGLNGTVTLIDSIVSFDVPRFELPSSRGATVGRVVLGEDDNRYDVRIEGDELALRDLQWLYPELPEEGGGSLVLRVQSQEPKGVLFLAERVQLTAPGTQMAGTFGVVAGDTLYFTAVDLRASPLDLDLIERLVPGGLPVEGLLIGTVEVTGPLSALRTEGDVRFARRDSDARNAVRWAGTLDVRRGIATRGIAAELDGLDLALISAFRPGTPLHGRVTGNVDASGRLADSVLVQAALEHEEAGRTPSRVEGAGSVHFGSGPTRLDLALDAGSISLAELGAWVPSLSGFRGTAAGPVHLSGATDDLRIAAELRADAGSLSFDVRVDRTDTLPRLFGSAVATDFQLRALSDSLPDARLNGDIEFDVTGRGLAGMSGPLRATFDTIEFAGVPVDRALLAGSLNDGVLRVDTLNAASAGLRLRADGEFGLIDGRSGALRVDFTGDDLASLEPLLFDDVDDPTRPRIQGTARATGVLTGSLRAFDVSAQAEIGRFSYDDETVESARLALAGSALNAADAALRLHATADSLFVLGRRLDSASIAATWDAGQGRLVGEARRGGQPIVVLDAAAQRSEGMTDLEIRHLALGSGDSAWTLGDTAVLYLRPMGATLDRFALSRSDGEGELLAGGTLAWIRSETLAARSTPRPLDFRVDARGIPFDEFLHLLDVGSGGRGTVDGSVTIRGVAHAPVIDVDVNVNSLGYDDIGVDRLTAALDYDSTRATARVDAFHNGRRVLFADGRIPADLRFTPTAQRRLAEQLDLTLQADSLPAALVFGLLDGFHDTQGLLDGAITASGTTREPELKGAMTLRRGATTWDATGVRYRDVAGTFLLERDRVISVDLSAGAADPSGDAAGTARITGTIDLERPNDPAFDLTARANQLLAAQRRDMVLTTSGTILIGGRYRAPLLSGEVEIDEGSLFIDELYRQYLVVGLENEVLFDVVDTSLVAVKRVLPSPESPFLRNLVVNEATIRVEPGSWLRSREMNVEVAGELTVSFNRQREDLQLSGTLTAIRGTYRLEYPGFARVFDVREGTVEFPGTPGLDPNLDITAVYSTRAQEGASLDILANLTGTLQNPRVGLSTEDELAISQSDLASYLFFGAPTYAFNIGGTPGSGDAGSGRFNWAINTIGFGYVASELQTLAQSVGIVDYIGLTAAETREGGQTQGLGGLLENTEIELGRYLGPNVFLAWSQRLDSNTSPGVRLEWRLNSQFATEFFYEDRFARMPGFSLGLAARPKKVAGFFLFREWGY
jgi:hypothetical protein